MKVLIITEGGGDIGFGHVSRCMAIRAAFAEQGVTPELIVNGDKELSRMAEDDGFRVQDWLHGPEQLAQSLEDADIALIDSYLAGPGFYTDVSRMARLPVYLDDCLRLSYPAGVVVNGAILAEGLDYPQRRDVEYLLGVRYFPLRHEFWEVPPLRPREQVRNIMVTFGGSDSAGLTPMTLGCLAEHAPDARKRVVIGKWFKNISEIERAGDPNTEFYHTPDADGMRELMLVSDLAISSGGQTLYELARVGLPTIAIAEADNQLNNVRGWEKTGFIFYAGRCVDAGLAKSVLTGFQLLQSQTSRSERNRIGRGSMDGEGARRLVNRLLSLARTRAQGLPS
ncbi:MAG: glycosyltransferase [Elusimicrobia bacterium]|nr:glycosyltransferase [Elusimicrobiota bacterium]